MDTKESIDAVAGLARAGLAEIVRCENGIGVFKRTIGAGGESKIESVKALYDEWRDAPERTKGVSAAQTLGSFIALVNRHKDGHSVVFGSITSSPSVTAVIDYTMIDHSPRFGEHRVVYAFPLSVEWQAWRGLDGKHLSQLDWAAFIEEHIADLASPMDGETSEYERLFQTKIALPTELLQLSRGMQINVESRVKEARTLQSGETELIYEEIHKDGAGQKLVVPGLFVVRIPLFVDGEMVRIICRLRYRKADGRITWFYQMYRPDVVMRERLRNDFAEIAKETELPVYEGSPEK